MSIANQMPHTESGITVNFPTPDYYQFEACQHYKQVSGRSIKEMDFIWYEKANKTVWLIELKGFFDPNNEKHQPTDLSIKEVIEKKLNELETKAIHSLIMLTTKRTQLHTCVDFNLTRQKIKIAFVLEMVPQQVSYLTYISDTLKDRIKTYATLFDIESIIVVNQTIGKAAGIKWL